MKQIYLFRKQTQLMLSLLVLLWLCNSCSVIRVVEVASPSATSAASGQHFGSHTVVRASMWNGRNGKQDIQSLCANGISRVKITTRPMDVVLGFITAGFVVTQRIDWDCSQRSGISDPEQ